MWSLGAVGLPALALDVQSLDGVLLELEQEVAVVGPGLKVAPFEVLAQRDEALLLERQPDVVVAVDDDLSVRHGGQPVWAVEGFVQNAFLAKSNLTHFLSREPMKVVEPADEVLDEVGAKLAVAHVVQPVADRVELVVRNERTKELLFALLGAIKTHKVHYKNKNKQSLHVLRSRGEYSVEHLHLRLPLQEAPLALR